MERNWRYLTISIRLPVPGTLGGKGPPTLGKGPPCFLSPGLSLGKPETPNGKLLNPETNQNRKWAELRKSALGSLYNYE
jgi:hypothetical protein